MNKKNSQEINISEESNKPYSYNKRIFNLIAKGKTKDYYDAFNEAYNEAETLEKKENKTQEEIDNMIDLSMVASIIIASRFDFEDSSISQNKEKYIEYAREKLYRAADAPYKRVEAMIYLIRALYGQTSIAYKTDNFINQQQHIFNGDKWVNIVEKSTKNNVAKGYALTQRAYSYIVFAKYFDMEDEERLKKINKELRYAVVWDKENYLGHYAFGLFYSDKNTSYYDKQKAIDSFNKVLEFKDKYVYADEFMNEGEKNKIMNLAKNKIELLKKM